jgi:hypothetical protein
MDPVTSILSARRHVSETEFRSIQSPVGSDTWFPINHAALMDEVEKAIFEMGVKLDESSKDFGLANSGSQGFGLAHLLEQDSDMKSLNGESMYTLSLGWINSTDKTIAARVIFGSRINISEAQVMVAECGISHKHTKNLMRDLPLLVREALSKFSVFKQYQSDLFSKLQETFIEPIQVHDCVCRAMRTGAIPNSFIKPILEEYENPQYSDFRLRTAFSLFNAFATCMKVSFAKNPVTAVERSILTTQLFDSMFVKNNG